MCYSTGGRTQDLVHAGKARGSSLMMVAPPKFMQKLNPYVRGVGQGMGWGGVGSGGGTGAGVRWGGVGVASGRV